MKTRTFADPLSLAPSSLSSLSLPLTSSSLTSSSLSRPWPRVRALAAPVLVLCVGGALAGCEAAVPQVKSADIVLPATPSKRVQALEAPSTDSSADSTAYCAGGGTQTRSEFNADGSFVTEFSCDAGGGIASIKNEGLIDPNTGDGAYDQTTTHEDGSASVWHFVVDTQDDGITQIYEGSSDDGSESSHSVYTYVDETRTAVQETWHSAAGDYVIDGSTFSDGAWEGTTTFDDPRTDASPDYAYDEVRGADGSVSQIVHVNGAGYTSDYTYDVNVDGSSRYHFDTDLADSAVAPDFSGSYRYNADFSGAGSYTQQFDDGSDMLVDDVIHADGTLSESWSFDDASTGAGVDQEGSVDFDAAGVGTGTVTTFVTGGPSQTCALRIEDGVSTVDQCTRG